MAVVRQCTLPDQGSTDRSRRHDAAWDGAAHASRLEMTSAMRDTPSALRLWPAREPAEPAQMLQNPVHREPEAEPPESDVPSSPLRRGPKSQEHAAKPRAPRAGPAPTCHHRRRGQSPGQQDTHNTPCTVSQHPGSKSGRAPNRDCPEKRSGMPCEASAPLLDGAAHAIIRRRTLPLPQALGARFIRKGALSHGCTEEKDLPLPRRHAP